MQNRDQLRDKLLRTYERLLALMSNYENLSQSIKTLYEKQLRLCETLLCIQQTAGDLGNITSKVKKTCTLKTYHNCLQGTTEISSQLNSYNYNANIKSELLSTFTIQTTSNQSYAFDRSRPRCIKYLVHAKRRDCEPSRIPMKKLVYLMSKNKTRRRRIKSFIRRFIPKSSSWHNLLSTRYRKYMIEKPTNTNMWRFPQKPTKLKQCLKRSLKITNKHTSRTRKHKLFKLNNAKIVNTNKCNVQRIKTSDKCLLFVCGDIELNPGPVNTSDMSVLTTRLARIGRKPVNIVGDGNWFFRSVSHQL